MLLAFCWLDFWGLCNLFSPRSGMLWSALIQQIFSHNPSIHPLCYIGSTFTSDMTTSFRDLEQNNEMSVLVFSNYKMAKQKAPQCRCATSIFTGLGNIHMINPSSTNTCKPITRSHYLSGVEVSSTARSKLLFKAYAVLHLGATDGTWTLIFPLAMPGLLIDPVISS